LVLLELSQGGLGKCLRAQEEVALPGLACLTFGGAEVRERQVEAGLHCYIAVAGLPGIGLSLSSGRNAVYWTFVRMPFGEEKTAFVSPIHSSSKSTTRAPHPRS